MTPNQRQFVVAAASLVLCATCIGCARAAPKVAPTGPIVLALVTWNMNAGRGDLPRLVDDLAAGRLTDAPVRDYALLLQEAVQQRGTDVTTFANARRLSVFYLPVRGSVSRTSGNAILSTRPLINPHAIQLPRARQPRTAVSAGIEVTGSRLFVASAHLENRVSWLRLGLFADSARGRQAAALIAALPPGHGVVGGDMNTIFGRSEPAWRAFLLRFADTPGAAAPTFRDRLVLDHLFFDLPDGWIATRQVLSDRYGSDHHPVLGVIRPRS
jgi:endonuclease/exonuclease/phosphatase family metal-dependent hydrolase